MTNPSYPLISFGLQDALTKAGISSVVDIYGVPSGSNKWSFSNLNDLSVGNKTVVPYATFEPDYWVLDGNHHFMPATPKIGYMDSHLSDASGNTNTDVVTIFFSALTTVQNMTLYFDINQGEWCSSIKVEAFTAGGSLIAGTGVVSPTSSTYQVSLTAANADHVNITIYKTSHAYRFARLAGIDFGDTVGYVTQLDKTIIKDATITEEFDPINETMTSNSIAIELVSSNTNYSVLNPAADFAGLSYHMPFSVYEVQNNEETLQGVFYLDTWENDIKENHVTFNCLDGIGTLAKTTFYGYLNSVMPGGISAISYIIGFLKTLTGIPYTLTLPATYSVTGNIGPVSCRDALQQLAFLLRLKILTIQSFAINITDGSALLDGNYDYAITTAQEFINKVSLLPIVTTINLSTNILVPLSSGVPVTIYTATLASGNYLIKLPSPVSQPTISGGTWNAPTNWYLYGGYYLSFTVSSPGTVTIQALGAPTTQQYDQTSYVNPSAPANTPTYVIDADFSLEFSGPSFPDTMLSLAQYLTTYYNYRSYQEATVLEIAVHAGHRVLIDSISGKKIYGFVTESILHLVGLHCDVKVKGVTQ